MIVKEMQIEIISTQIKGEEKEFVETLQSRWLLEHPLILNSNKE
jgi:hypothetical protein